MCFFSNSCGRIVRLISKRNWSPTLQRSRRMSCRPNPSPDSAKVWLLLPMPMDLSLHTLRFIHGIFIFFNRRFLSIFFPSIPRRSTTPQFCLLYATSLFAFCSFFQFLYAVQQHLPSHMPVRKAIPDKTHNFQWHMFQLHVAPRPLVTVLLHLLAMSFSRNYCGWRGRR